MASVSSHISRLFSSVAGLLASHLRLFGIELREEVSRAAVLLVFLLASAAFAFLFLLVATLLILFLCWETCRVEAACILLGCYGIFGAVCLTALRRRLMYFGSDGQPFAATLDELERDQRLLHAAPSSDARSVTNEQEDEDRY